MHQECFVLSVSSGTLGIQQFCVGSAARMARQFLHSNDIQCTILQNLAIRSCLIIFGLLVMHQPQLQDLSLCWYTRAWVKEWASMGEMSGAYGIWVEIITLITPVLSVLCIKKLTLGALVWHTCSSDIICAAEFVYLCAELHTRTHLNFTFKPPITITFLKSCQNYLVPRNQHWDYRLLAFDQIHFGLFLMGGLCLGFFYLPGTENPYISKLKHNFSLACIFYFAYTCGFHVVNILSLESLK